MEALARIRAWFVPPFFADDETDRLAAVVYGVSFVLGAVAVLSVLLVALEPSPKPRLGIVLVFLLGTVGALALTRAGQVRSAAAVLVAVGWTAIALGAAATRLASPPMLAAFVVAVTAAGLLLGAPAAFTTAFLSSTVAPSISLLWSHFAPDGASAPASEPGQWTVEAAIYFAAAALVSIAVREMERSMRRARQSEARFRALAENAGDMIFELDEAGRFVFANERSGVARLMRGIDDTLATTRGPVVHPDDVAAVAAAFREVSRFKGPRELSCRVIDACGETRWVESSANAFRDEQGRARVVVVSRDVTEQRKMEAALRDSEARYRMLAEHAPDIIVEYDAAGRIVYANPRALEFAGKTLDELGTLELASGTHPDDFEICLQVFGQVVREGKPARAVHRLRRADGEYVWRASSGVPIVTTSGELHMIVQSRDLTEELSLQEQLRQAQKMEAIGRLAGGVAHDFNNLLTVIGGYAGLIEAALPAGASEAHAAREIQHAIERAAGLTRQLLALSRRQLAQRSVVDLNAEIRELEPVLRRALPESIELVLSIPDEAAPVEVDPSQVDQVLLNLALNARDAMIEPGTLTIQTWLAGGGDTVHLHVSDTGVGMDEATRQRAFEPFFTTKPAGFGSGLGLSTTYGIVRQAGGTITLDSAPGQGTRVHIELPAAREAAVARASRLDPGATPLVRDASILLVEDDASVRRLLSIVLEAAGYRVRVAADASEALLVAEAAAREIDLLLTDYVLPDQSGLELCHALRKRWPALRVVLMTGYAEVPDGDRSSLPRGVDLIAKPFTREQLGAAIARRLATA